MKFKRRVGHNWLSTTITEGNAVQYWVVAVITVAQPSPNLAAMIFYCAT